jgi:SDR family mycofactocin-dependent oxidoreductase
MERRVAGKVALITGAARGQGRSHALRLAENGADIIAVDFCTDFKTVSYPMASRDDLNETQKAVEALGQRALPLQADVRDPAGMATVVQEGLDLLGKIDIVIANAGICAMAQGQSLEAWAEVSSVNFGGVLNTINTAIPVLGAGASVIVTGSIAAGRDPGRNPEPGVMAYWWAKRALVTLVRDLGLILAPHSIRVNGVHPTNCNTTMLQHDAMYKKFRPDLENPTIDEAIPSFTSVNAMRTPWVEPLDISNVMLFLASDESRYVTGQFISCDAGANLSV